MSERLQKILARAGVAARRKAEQLILAGRVTVNGQKVTTLGAKAEADADDIRLDGQPISLPATVVYLLNKPAGVVTTAHDPFGRKRVIDLVPSSPRVFPVGRLDRLTEGLILLTNDGDLALRLTHPRFEHPKEYLATGFTKRPVAEVIKRLQSGVRLDGSFVKPDHVELQGIHGGQVVVAITVHEGRTHLIRRLCSRVKFEITRLVRVRIGELRLGTLPPGRYRRLEPEEVATLTELATTLSRTLPPDPTTGSGDR